MVTFIIRWDSVQMAEELEWRMWKQIRGAFFTEPTDTRFIFVPVYAGLNVEQYDTMDEALSHATGERVFLEPGGSKSIAQIPAGDVTMIFGNSQLDNLAHAAEGEVYTVLYPGGSSLYGTNAAVAALAVRFGQ